MPQMKALYNVIEYIFDRNASLLPAYFIVTEVQKDYPDNNHWPHWVSLGSKLLLTMLHMRMPCVYKYVGGGNRLQKSKTVSSDHY